ncbi:MAG: tetratricopeptide repeat protein [Phycisphaera sp.]|nr:tetratricopeptide repeat protein [Phycisphaera sp.]
MRFPSPFQSLTTMVLIVSVAGLCACAGKKGVRQTEPNYATVTAQPNRNTDEARRLNDEGYRLMDEGKWDDAAQTLRRALSADVEFGPAHNNLGKVYYHSKDWYRAAIEFDSAATLMPRRAEPLNNLALVLEQAGELDRAVEKYREATTLEPDNTEFRGNLVRALVKRGDRTEEVRLLLEQVIKEDKRPDWLIWARQQLAGMKKPEN